MALTSGDSRVARSSLGGKTSRISLKMARLSAGTTLNPPSSAQLRTFSAGPRQTTTLNPPNPLCSAQLRTLLVHALLPAPPPHLSACALQEQNRRQQQGNRALRWPRGLREEPSATQTSGWMWGSVGQAVWGLLRTCCAA